MLSYNDLVKTMESIKSTVLIKKEYISISCGDIDIHVTNNGCWERDYVSYTVYCKDEIISKGDSVGLYADLVLIAVAKREPKTMRKQILNFFGV